MILNFVVMWVVSKFTHEPPQEVQDLVVSLRYPKESTHV
jgi:cation/acetate symporter